MAHLDSLTRCGLRASIQPDGKIRLEPDWLITDSVRQIVRDHREELVREITENAVPGDPSVEVVPDYHILWVATDLDSFEEFDPRFGYELSCDPVYRMLDAPYYAWLYRQMERLKGLWKAGKVEADTYNATCVQFREVHGWAVRWLGSEALDIAVDNATRAYMAPCLTSLKRYDATLDAARRENVNHACRTDHTHRKARRDVPGPAEPCYTCGQTAWWFQAESGMWVCRVCHPDVKLADERAAEGERR